MRPIRPTYLVIVLSLLMVGSVQADDTDAPVLVIERIESGQVVFDGVVDEPIWDTIQKLPLSVHEPIYHGEPTEETEIYVTYDDAYFYVAGRLYTKNKGDIRANSLYRDRYSGDDIFAVILDTYNDNENGLFFMTNPEGVRYDYVVENDAAESRGFPANPSWDTYWDSQTSRDEDGWYAEMRIPFSSLGFQNIGDRVEMGMIAYRFMAGARERHLYPDIEPNYSFAWLKPSLAQDIVIEGVAPSRPVYVTPYALGGLGYQHALNADETAYDRNGARANELGLDIQTNLTSNLAMDLTVNTDFAQVEVDDEQVNLTRFSLFLPEKRQFFQQRAGIFDIELGRQDALFYSRRIGIGDDGPIRILGGARMVGRIGNWDVGFVDMQTARDSEQDAASENFGVLRLRKKMFNDQSYVGGMFTSRIDENGDYNLTYAADAVLNPFGSDYVTLLAAQTAQEGFSDVDVSLANSMFLRANWERRTNRGFNYDFTAVWSGEGFDPGIGFIRRNHYRNGVARLGWGWYPESGPVRRWSQSFYNSLTSRDADNVVESVFSSSFTTFEFRNGLLVRLSARMRYEDLPEILELPFDSFASPGRYWSPEFSLDVNTPGSENLRLESEIETGGYYDGFRFTSILMPAWTLSKHLELEAEYELNYVDLPDFDPFDIHIGRIRAQVNVNKSLSAATFVQYSNVSEAFTTNFRLRYNFSQGTDFWLVYNEAVNTDLLRLNPSLPRSDGRSLLVKYTRTFTI